ncbi:MAG: exo-beta-N-acetylmuramidase NamZ domain-containing protein [Candidatus Neomarinimicrobiota bacterium]
MIHLIKILLYSSATLVSINCQQTKTDMGIHQSQSIYFKNKPEPLTEKIKVLNGIDVLLKKKLHFIQSRKIALVTNHSGVDKNLVPNYKRLMEVEDVELKVIFSPEHGLFGESEAGEKINYTELKELPKVISLYGGTRKPSAEMLDGVNLIIYDIQDIGARFYTYISTLGLVMEAGAELGIPVLVLDRPNPIRGDIIEGPILDIKYQSFVGQYPIATRYGGTVGELAKKIIKNKWITSLPELEIIKMEGWQPNAWFDQTDLPWVAPSPNIPDLKTAIIYPGMCLFEGTNVSEGRGTPNPFKWIGAPWIDGKKLSQTLNNFKLPGVVFVPKSFIPVETPGKSENPKFKNQKCHGIEVWITDRDQYKSIDVGVLTLFSIYNMYPNDIKIRESGLNRLWGSNELYKKLLRGVTVDDILKY